MNYKLKTKSFRMKYQNVTKDEIINALFTCYSNVAFSTFPYLIFKYDSLKTSQILNSGNCIAMSYYLKNYLKENLKITSYLIPASIPKIYQAENLLHLSHVAIFIPIDETKGYICDTAFYFLQPILVVFSNSYICEDINSVNVYSNTNEIVCSKYEYLDKDLVFNEYQMIPKKTHSCKCYYKNDSNDSWSYYLREILEPDHSIGNNFLSVKNKPFICTTQIRNGTCVMDVYLKYISDTEVKIEYKLKPIYTGRIINIPEEIREFLNIKLFKYLKTNINKILASPLYKNHVF